MSHQCDNSLLDTLYLVIVFFHVRWYLLLPPINEVWGKVIFSVACVKNSVHREGGSASVHAGIPPGTKHPQEQAPPGPGTPSEQCMLGDSVNKRAVCILLECNLVLH